VRVRRRFRFEAAHFLPHVPAGHPCGRMHGHSYRILVRLRGDLDPTLGWVRDFAWDPMGWRMPIPPKVADAMDDAQKWAISGTRAVLAPGTGLGQSALVWDGQTHHALPSEGGHADFAPTGKDQMGLLSHLARTVDHVSWELVCSGIGIPNIFLYLKDSGRHEMSPELEERMASAQDMTPIIVEGALKNQPPCPLCVETLRIFVSILGAESGNLALKVLSTGGLYIGGGIPPRILPLLMKSDFMRSFTAKGRMTGIMRDMPVHVILNARAAFMGAAKEGLELLTRFANG